MVTSSAQPIVYCFKILSLLHRNDSQLIFFVYPNKESFVIVMEYSSCIWPISIETASFQESITFFKQEVIFYQLFSLRLSEVVELIILSSEISLETVQSLNNFLFYFFSLLVFKPRSETVLSKISSDSYSSATNHLSICFRE